MSLAAIRKQLPHLNDYTDQEILHAVAAATKAQPGSPQYQRIEKDLLGYDRTVGGAVKDTGVGLAQGVMGLGKIAGTIGGALLPGVSAFDNAVTNKFGEWSEDLDQFKTQGLRNREAGAAVNVDVAQRTAQANGEGMVGRFTAGLGAQLGSYWENPSLAFQDLTTNAPQLLAGGLIGRGVQAGATALGAGVKTATKVGLTAGVGSGGAMQGSDVGADTYARLRAAGASHEQATALASEAAAKSGGASIGLSLIPGAATVERSLLKGGATPMRFGLGRAGTVARVGATEAVAEGADEGYGRFAANQGVQVVDPNTDLMGGVGQAFTQGGVVGGPMGTVAGFSTTTPTRPRTETGEIDLTGVSVGPSEFDTPAYVRRGLDPLEQFNAPANMTDIAGPVIPSVQRPEASYTDLVAPPAPPPELDPYTEWSQQAAAQRQAEAQAARRTAAEQGTSAQGQGVMMATPDGTVLPPMAPEQVQQVDAMRRLQAQQAEGARQARRAELEAGSQAQGTGVMVTTPDGTVLPAQTPEQLAETERFRQTLADRPPLPAPKGPNRGQLLSALASANKELGKNTIKKDGELSNARGNAPLRAVLEATDPLAAMREAHQDGANPRDELLDVWHKNLTGKTVFEWKAEQAELNSAGFVQEPQAQVDAQVAAVRDGRKDAAVLGEQEAIKAQLEGLATGVATGPDGAKAVVVSKDPAKVDAAVARAKEVGLKQAMGETLGVANPTITGQPEAPAAVAAVQQVDDKSGQVIAEELVTPADLPNVKPVPGTTARVVPMGQPVADRRAAMPAATQAAIAAGKKPKPAWQEKVEKKEAALEAQIAVAKANAAARAAARVAEPASAPVAEPKPKKAKAHKFGRKPTAELIEIAENTKDEAEMTQARYEMYRRWAEDTDDGASEAYLTDKKNKSDLSKAEKEAFQKRYQEELEAKGAKKAQELGKKFGATFRTGGGNATGVPVKQAESVAAAVTRGWTNTPPIEVVATIADLPTDLREQAERDGAPGAKAAFVDGKVWVVADNHSSLGDVVTSILHEVAGHYGLRGALGAQFQQTMRQIYSGNPDVRKAADAMMAEEGLDLETAVEEVLADMAETGRVKPSVLERIGNAIRQIMRKVGLGQFATGFTNAEVKEIVANARRFVEEGAPTEVADGPAVFRRESTIVKPFSDAAKSVAASVKAKTSGTEISPTLLSMLSLRQIDEQFGKKLPALRDWIGAIMQRSSNASALAAEADRVALQWEKSVKDPAERKALADILLRASVAELQLDNTTDKYLAELSPAERAEHTALRTKLAALSPEARKTREQALAILKRQWDYTRTSLESFIHHTVADPALRNQRIADLKQEMGRNRGDYFPLSRFGDRIVIGRGAAKDGRDTVSFHESAAGADAEVARLKAAGVKKIDVTLQTERDSRQRATTGFIGSLHQMIDASEADSGIKDSMHEALQQLYLKSLPELSGAKHMIRRESVEGYSQDALRVFADAVTRGARYASHLEYGPVVQAAMESAEAQARSSDKRTAAVVIGRKGGEAPRVMVVPTGTDRLNAVNRMAEEGYDTEFFNTVPESAKERLAGALEGATTEQIDGYVSQVEATVGRTLEGVEDTRAAKALYNHMVKLQKTEANQDPSVITEALGQIGYTWFLGFSPAFWAMNSMQNPMIGIPHLGAKYGVGKAAAEWMGAMKWFGGVRMGKLLRDGKTPFSVEWLKGAVKDGKLGGITKQELDMLQALEDRQILDFTQAMDLSRIGQASNDKRYKLMRLAAAGAHHTEVFNRVTFALAAYRLALKSGGNVTHAEAVRRAENDTAAVHFDYSYANKPEMMRGKKTRLIFMFQQYRQHMLYWWAKNIKDMVKGEAPGDRTRALKAALLMGTTQGVFAGALGLPFVGSVAFLANLLGGDDDDGVPFDFNTWITEAAVDATGSKEAGEVMAKGIFAALGMNISQRIGQGDLLPFLNEGSAKFERNADDKMRAYLFDLAGPLGSIALGAARATEAFGRGDTAGGIAATTPKAVSDIIKAYQLETEGMKDKKGQFLATAEAFDGSDVFMQAAGVAPTAVARVRADRGRVMEVETALKDRTRQITGQFVEAWLRGDRDGVMEAVEEVKEFNRKTGAKFKDRSLLIDGRQLEMAIRDRQRRALLLALTGGTAETKRQLLLATQLSGLYNPVTADSIRENAAGGLPGLPGLPGN